MTEKLISVAIKRDGETHSRGFKSHYALRAALGDKLPDASKAGDEEGFLTSEDRFVGRWEAYDVAIRSGQLSGGLRKLLSSDVNW